MLNKDLLKCRFKEVFALSALLRFVADYDDSFQGKNIASHSSVTASHSCTKPLYALVAIVCGKEVVLPLNLVWIYSYESPLGCTFYYMTEIGTESVQAKVKTIQKHLCRAVEENEL